MPTCTGAGHWLRLQNVQMLIGLDIVVCTRVNKLERAVKVDSNLERTRGEVTQSR